MAGRGEWVRRSAMGFAVLVASAGVAAGLSNPNDFCTGNPCVISADKVVDAGAVLDFGTRTVILQKQLTIAALPNGAIGSFTLKCGTFQISGSDGQIKGTNASGPGGSATIEALNDIQINGTASIGAVRLTGQDAGVLTLTTTNGSISGSGRINLSGDGLIASGGTLVMRSGSTINYSGQISAPGGTQGGGGLLDIGATGNITFTNLLDLTGGEVGGGELDVFGQANVTLGEVDLSANGDAGDAGFAVIEANGSVTLSGRVRGRGADNGENCGDGADIDINALGNLTINGEMDIRGRGLDCSGGFLSLDGENVFLNGLLQMSGTGTESDGGDLDVSARTLIRVVGTVQIDGGDSGAGDVLFLSDKDIDIQGQINAYGRSSISPGSALVEFDAQGTLTVSGDIDASGGPNAPMGGGDVTLGGCKVDVKSTALIKSLGDLGGITVQGNDKVTLRGVFQAGSGGNDIEFGPRAAPPDIAGASFSPAATLIPNATLLPCRACDTNADCNDNNTCTSDTCAVDGLTCLYAPVVGSCNDGNACTTGDTCVGTLCVGGAPPNCDDGKVCTADSCAPASGCTHTNVVGACNDGNLCTTGDSCSGGNCVGTPLNCSDGNPCTNDVCTLGVCSNPNNTLPCSDGTACTNGDVCSGGSCVPGPTLDCDDHNACTIDSCNPSNGCQHSIGGSGCADTDGDGTPDELDPCTTLDWTPFPVTPPNQHPRAFTFGLGKLVASDGEQRLLLKGVFNSAPASIPIDPTANGIHLYAADAAGAFFDVSLPGGAGCAAGDGWTTVGVGFKKIWVYRNKSGTLPPSCAAGSARGITSVQIRDQRLSNKHGLQFKVKMKNGSLQRDPVPPLTRVQVSLALAAQPAPGVASPQAKAGECAEALLTGNPIASRGKPFCKPKLSGAALDGLTCKE
ncbi:MAG: hypothetical protein SF182_03825 [Deltaproteobacteria bacterium]|nr:hypothetical protein [Deltaproteobacteria bacterium]